MLKTVNIFVSSTFRNMHLYRDQMMYEVRPLINQMLQTKKLDIQLNFIDLRWGVDERLADSSLGMYSQIIETCFRSLDETDIFIGMYTDYRGTLVPNNEIDLLNEQYHWSLPYNNSLTELEYWYCKRKKTTPTKYCQIYFVDPNSSSQEITESGDFITVKGTVTKELSELVAKKICEAIEDEVSIEHINKADDINGFWVFRSKNIEKIVSDLFETYAFEDEKEGRVKLTVLTGESGIGKSVLLSQLNTRIKKQGRLLPVYLSDASHVSALEDLMDKALSTSNIELPREHMTLAKRIQYFQRNFSSHQIPCFIIDSIDDISPEYFNHFLVELSNTFSKCHVITSTTKHVEKGLQEYIHRIFEIEAFDKEEIKAAINLHEKIMMKQFPDIIRNKLLEVENTVYAKPIIFQLVLNDLSLLSANDYASILKDSRYSLQIETIMMNRFQNYPDNVHGIIDEVCSRIAGSAETAEDNLLVRQYITLILLSYMGVTEEYMSNVMGEDWKPLLFYQLKYSFRNIFVAGDNNLLMLSHHIFKSTFYKMITSEMREYIIKKIISKNNIPDDGLEFEKYRMCFFGEHYDSWYQLVQTEKSWDYLTECLIEYCQSEHPYNKEYLLIPIHWIEYMTELSSKGKFCTQDYLELTGKIYGFIDQVIATTSTRDFDKVIYWCQCYAKAFEVFADNCNDEKALTALNDITKYIYHKVIGCAEDFSVHEKVNEIVNSYETLVARNSYLSESNHIGHKQIIEQEMESSAPLVGANS